MSPQNIYLIRHAQTDFNKNGIVQGSGIDSSINEKGREQVALFKQKYGGIAFDRIYTSELLRTTQTVAPFLEEGFTSEVHSGLNEICWGVHEGKKIDAQEGEYYNWVLSQWQAGNTALKIKGGESPEDVVQRQSKFVELIKSRKNDKNILICTHGRVLRILLSSLLNYPLKCMDFFEHSNLCLYVVGYTGMQYSLKAYNNVDHLKGHG